MGWLGKASAFRSTGEEGERGSRGEMQRMRAKSEVPVVVAWRWGRDLGRELARHVRTLLVVGA
jgi:hypothetical protein